MNTDAELELWREQWHAATVQPIATDLRKRVARQTRFMRIGLAGEVLVTAVIGGGATWQALLDGSSENVVLAVAVWLFIAVAWTFGLSVRRGSWSPSAANTSAYLDLSLRRCRGNLRAATFGSILYCSEMAF